MCEFWRDTANYSRFGVLMVYLCEFRSKTDNEARHGFLAIRYMPNGVFNTALRLPEYGDRPSEDGAFLPPLPYGWR